MSHTMRASKDITGVHCATCHVVRGVEQVEPAAESTTFTLACGHTVTLLSGVACGLDVREDQIVIYPDRAHFPPRRGGV